MGFGVVSEPPQKFERPVAAPAQRQLSAAGSFGREGDRVSTACARWGLLLETAVGPPPGESEIAGEAGVVGGMASGEEDVATPSAVHVPVESARPGCWEVCVTDAGPWTIWTIWTWVQQWGRAAQGRCWRLDRGARGGAMMTSTATRTWRRRHGAGLGCEVVEAGVVRWSS